MSFKKDFGARLRFLRKQRGLSQEKFSENIGVAQNTLSNIETGINFCSAETIEKILNVLEVEPFELFNFGQKNPKLELLNDINEILSNNPEKIDDIWKIVRVLTI